MYRNVPSCVGQGQDGVWRQDQHQPGWICQVDHFDWDAFNEGRKAQVERFRELTGKYPELVQVDKIYLTRENRRF